MSCTRRCLLFGPHLLSLLTDGRRPLYHSQQAWKLGIRGDMAALLIQSARHVCYIPVQKRRFNITGSGLFQRQVIHRTLYVYIIVPYCNYANSAFESLLQEKKTKKKKNRQIWTSFSGSKHSLIRANLALALALLRVCLAENLKL